MRRSEASKKLDTSLLQGRRFKLWHYLASHSHLLIRSSIDVRETTNIDLWFVNVRYVELGVYLGEVSLDEPTEEERARLRVHDEFLDQKQITVIVSDVGRSLVVSSLVHIEENTLDLFETPYGSAGGLSGGIGNLPRV
ncbi:hypothetical protein [Pelagibius sp.]|uniref:hypothetical protein n=1 Tax=Pelagibius sp. TaxID=1931238 RepID=UPI003B50ADF8